MSDRPDATARLSRALDRLDEREPAAPPYMGDPGHPCAATAGGDPASDLAGLIERANRSPTSVSHRSNFASPPTDLPEHLAARLERVRTLDADVRAFATLVPIGDAPPASGPLAGVTIGHKDILCTAGVPTRAGSALLEGHVPDFDAEVVSLLRAAGAQAIGKLVTHEFATGVTGTVAAGAIARNPRCPDRVPGGSSSGSAAAVAAGLVDAATGTDTGGSIRIPAACCGVVGFKPTLGRISTRGVIPFSWTLDHVGALAGSCELAARMVSAMSAGAIGEPEIRPRLRLGVASDCLAACEPAVVAAFDSAVAALRARGHEIVDVALPDSWDDTPAIAAAIFLAEGAAFHSPGLRTHRDSYRPETLALLDRADLVTGARYVRAHRLRAELIAALEAPLADLDALLLPALPCLPPRLDQQEVRLPTGLLDVRAALTLFTRPFNLTGQPALVLPVGSSATEPVGVQMVGRRHADERLLGAGLELEGLLAAPPPGAPGA